MIEFGECFDGSFKCADLSALKFMRVLYVNVPGPANDEPIDWGCLYCLSSLQVLTLHSTTQGLKTDQNMTLLGNLSCLTLMGAASTYGHVELVVSVAINFNWGALQNIYIESPNMLECNLELSSDKSSMQCLHSRSASNAQETSPSKLLDQSLYLGILCNFSWTS